MLNRKNRVSDAGPGRIISASVVSESTSDTVPWYRTITSYQWKVLIAAKVGRGGWTFAFQSASHTNEPWLGPDILVHLQGLADKGQRDFLIAPIGFVCDHLEILYDIDVECAQWAKEQGVTLARCESLNDSDELIDCLHSLVVKKHFQ